MMQTPTARFASAAFGLLLALSSLAGLDYLLFVTEPGSIPILAYASLLPLFWGIVEGFMLVAHGHHLPPLPALGVVSDEEEDLATTVYIRSRVMGACPEPRRCTHHGHCLPVEFTSGLHSEPRETLRTVVHFSASTPEPEMSTHVMHQYSVEKAIWINRLGATPAFRIEHFPAPTEA